MILQKQRTLKTEISYTGIGLHSGREVHATLKPAPEDTGIVFVRTDLPGAPQIHAKVEEDGHKVFTIEHLMSAFHAHRIDNAYVELDSEEPPVADGASLVFFELMAKAGIVEQAKDRKEIVIDKVYRIDDEKTGRFVMVLPYDGFRVSFTSLNPHKLIGVQYEDFHIDEAVYHKEIAPARTIAYEKEIQALREMGLGLGGSLENVIVYNDEGWLNPLHFEDELVRHKILDVIGDLRLAGIIRGHVIAAASGHALNTQLAKEIAAAYAGR